MTNPPTRKTPPSNATTKRTSRSAQSRSSNSNKTVHTNLTTQSNKTTPNTNTNTNINATTTRKSRLPSLLAFRKRDKRTRKRKESKSHVGGNSHTATRPTSTSLSSNTKRVDDDSSTTSALSHKSKTALLTEFSTLMNEFPTDDTLNTTLHVACRNHYSDSLIVDQLIRKGPMAASMINQKRDLPLHSAMRSTIGNGIDDRVYDALVKIHPAGIHAINADNCLPLHLICQSGGRNLYVVQKLVQKLPVGVMMKCDLKLEFDSQALKFVQRTGARPKTAKFANEDDHTKLTSVATAKSEDAQSESQSESLSGSFWSALLMFAPKGSSPFDENPFSTSADPGLESSFSPLHLAVMNGAPPDVIEMLITANPQCLGLKTDQGRRPLDLAMFLVADKENKKPYAEALGKVSSEERIHDNDNDNDNANDNDNDNEYIRNIDEDPGQNVFAAIEIMKTFEGNRRKSAHLANATQMTSASFRDLSTIVEFNPRKQWKKLSNIIQFSGALRRAGSVMGPPVPSDLDMVMEPTGYFPRIHLNHVCVEIELPVGFRRLRWAMLHSNSKFLTEEVLQSKLGYSQVAMSPWDKCDGITGDVQSHDQIQDRAKDRIGAKRSCQYLMPKSGMVGANMAYETHTILEYDDYTFVMKKVITNPDVPFGKSFECHVQTVFINLGNNNCKMISSVEAQFLGRPPMVAWKIRNAMYNGVTDFFVAKGEVICEHSFREREIGT